MLDKLCFQPWPGEGESEAGSIIDLVGAGL